MFYIGEWDKQKILSHYIENNGIEFVLVIYSERLHQPRYSIPVKHEYIEWHQTIMYKNYYRLLQTINRDALIVCDNILVNQNRYQLEYNCINNYINQTPHRLVFNHLPFIEDEKDFMILLDFYNKNLYKGEPFRWQYLEDVNLRIKPVHLEFEFVELLTTEKDRAAYQKKRDALFDGIGLGDPDTIPRRLAITAGDIRRQYISRDDAYTARNMRCKGYSMTTYKEDELHTIFDFPAKRLELIQLLTLTGQKQITALTSDLSIDRYYRGDYIAWRDRLEAFYDKAAISRG